MQGLDREETEKMRKDYEYRITSLQNKVASLQDEVDNGIRVRYVRPCYNGSDTLP